MQLYQKSYVQWWKRRFEGNWEVSKTFLLASCISSGFASESPQTYTTYFGGACLSREKIWHAPFLLYPPPPCFLLTHLTPHPFYTLHPPSDNPSLLLTTVRLFPHNQGHLPFSAVSIQSHLFQAAGMIVLVVQPKHRIGVVDLCVTTQT